jgi:hypothetical protein
MTTPRRFASAMIPVSLALLSRGKAAELATTVKHALELTAWEKPKPEST